MDGDGDTDGLIGNIDGRIKYFKNLHAEGSRFSGITNIRPLGTFQEMSEENNPLGWVQGGRG